MDRSAQQIDSDEKVVERIGTASGLETTSSCHHHAEKQRHDDRQCKCKHRTHWPFLNRSHHFPAYEPKSKQRNRIHRKYHYRRDRTKSFSFDSQNLVKVKKIHKSSREGNKWVAEQSHYMGDKSVRNHMAKAQC